jgi:hypothetical protein
MMRIAVVLLLATVAVAQQTPAPEAQSFTRPAPKVATTSPGMHLAISNSSVRVFNIELAPHGSAAIGREVRDYMLLAVSGGTAEIAGPGNMFPLDLKSGEIQIFKGGWPHQLRSKSDTATTWIVLELIHALNPERASCGLGGAGCSQFKFGKTDQGEYSESLLFETPSARVLRAELAAASTLPTHTDRLDHVVVPLSACTLAVNGDPTARAAGESVWVHGALPELRNTGADAAKFVILEIK